MSAIAFLQQLLDAGLPLEAAMTAARLHEEAMASVMPTAPTKAAERTRRWRERKASQSVTDRHETSRGDASDAAPLPLPSSPHTPQQPTPTPGEILPARKGRSKATGNPDFDAFWAAYPLSKAKDTAKAAFAKAMARIDHDDPLSVILAGIERALPGWDLETKAFIPHPATWLNAGSWEDEAPTLRPEKPANDHHAPHARSDRRNDRHAATLDNYDAHWAGAEQAADVLAARRAY